MRGASALLKLVVVAVVVTGMVVLDQFACPATTDKSIVNGRLSVNIPAGISYTHTNWHLDAERVIGRKRRRKFSIHATHKDLPQSFVHIEEASWRAGGGFTELENAEGIFEKAVPRLDDPWKSGVAKATPQVVRMGDFSAYGCTWKEGENYERSFLILVARPDAYIVAMRLPAAEPGSVNGAAYAKLLSVATNLTRAIE